MKPGMHDAVRRVDHRRGVARHRDIRPDLADLAVLDQHVGLREVADCAVEGEHDAALEQDAAFSLHPGKQAVGRSPALGKRAARQHLGRRRAGHDGGARREQRPARRRCCRRLLRLCDSKARRLPGWSGGRGASHLSFSLAHGRDGGLRGFLMGRYAPRRFALDYHPPGRSVRQRNHHAVRCRPQESRRHPDDRGKGAQTGGPALQDLAGHHHRGRLCDLDRGGQAQDRGRRQADRPQGRAHLQGDAALLADRRAGLRAPARRHDDRRRRQDSARRIIAGRGSRSSSPSSWASR